MQTFMAVIAGGTVYQETTAWGTTHVMVMETSCAGLAGQTRLQTVLHVRNIPGTFSAFFCVCVWWFDTSQSMEQCTAVLSVIAIFEFEKMNICGCQWKYRPNFARVER